MWYLEEENAQTTEENVVLARRQLHDVYEIPMMRTIKKSKEKIKGRIGKKIRKVLFTGRATMGFEVKCGWNSKNSRKP